MVFKMSIDDLLIRLVLLFPSAMLLQGLPGLDWINKCIVAIILVLILWQMRGCFDVWITGVLCSAMSIAAVILSNRIYLHIQDVFYFPLFILYCMYWTKRSWKFETVIQKNLKFGWICILLWGLLVTVSVLFPTSYSHDVMNTIFFRSFSTDPFRLASSCVIIMLMLHILAYYRKTALFFGEAVPMAVIFATGTRIYLLFGGGMLLLSMYLLVRNKRTFWLSTIPVLMIMTVAVLNSSIMDKFTVVAASQESFYGNFLDAFTSGRTVFWSLDLEAFGELPLWKQLIGNGLSFAYEVTGTRYVRSIWAHNDYIHILLSYGWIGLGLYCHCFFRFAAQFKKTFSLRFWPYLCAVGLCVGNAFINGLYFYSAAMLAIPFLFYGMSLDKGNRNNKVK